MGYTQFSNCEAYNDSAHFKHDDSNPELFYQLKFRDFKSSIGFKHQSNATGGTNEASWNRVNMNLKLKNDYVSIRVKPWSRIHDINDYNPDIIEFMGYGEIELGWTPTKNQEFKILDRNMFENNFKRAYYNMVWSSQYTMDLRGYMKYESGYGVIISNYNFDETAYPLGSHLRL